MLVFTLIAVIKTPWFKGLFGEAQVNLAAKIMLDKKEYHLIHNVTLPTESGSTQIDHIIVSRYGIFVIETKNMKGWIFGGEHQRTWTQKIFNYTSKFQNPLHQNYKHIKTLEACLKLPEEYFFSLIVFVGDSTFKTVMPINVTYAGGYLRYIKSKTIPLLSDEIVRYAHDMIQFERLIPSIATNRAHVASLKMKTRGRQAPDDICPNCGKELVERITRNGPNRGKKFIGCTGFPLCRYTRKILQRPA